MKDFLTTTQTRPPQIPLPYYLVMLMVLALLAYLSWSWHAKKSWRLTFLGVQAVQLISLYIWYICQGFPLDDSLPLYHCRLAMLALLLLKDSKVKTYFALMGLVGGSCAIIHPILIFRISPVFPLSLGIMPYWSIVSIIFWGPIRLTLLRRIWLWHLPCYWISDL